MAWLDKLSSLIFDGQKPKVQKDLVKEIKIQAMEGQSHEVIIESMLTGRVLNTSVPGTVNAFTSYESQVRATYAKYNSRESFGNQQTRTVVDLRTAFIAGEGLSVVADKEQTKKWIKDFLFRNRLNGVSFINAVKGTEMAGQALFILKPTLWRDGSLYTKALRIPYTTKRAYKPVYVDDMVKDEVFDILVRKDGVWVSAGFSNFIYVRTGGDDVNDEGPVTKVGVVLTDLENYDRAIKDIRRLNHVLARVTPVFQTKNDTETTSITKQLNDSKWKIGTSYIGSAEFSYETPGEGAHRNLISELVSTVKTISGTTGVPVHWFGYVDLMSNRSTAESLYELIKNQTINERTEWESALYEMIVKAQELFIDSGGTGLSLDLNFQVKLPLLNFGQFLERIRAYSLAYADTAISIDDYRNAIPGIDPAETEKAVEAERKEKEKLFIKTAIPEEGDDENGDDEDE